jgi:hypothetical protein
MRQWLIKALVIFGSILLGLALVEAGLRLGGIEYPLFYDFDPILGNSLRPGVQGYFTTEGKGYVRINSDGLRDDEHSVARPQNTLRIAVLGDSYAEAMQVNQEEAFWAVMEKELQQCHNLGGRQVEVINFGHSSFGTSQELLILQHRVWKYSPDIVLLAFVTGNDIADNSRLLKGVEHHPYHVYQGEDLILDDRQTRESWEARKDGFMRRVVYPLHLDRLRVVQVVHHFKNMWGTWSIKASLNNFLSEDDGRPQRPPKGKEPGLTEMVYREPATPAWQEAWRVTEGVLLQMREEVARHGAQFLVVVLTNGAQVDPDPKRSAIFAKWLGVPDLFYPDRRVEKFCQKHGIPVLLLGPSFQEYAVRRQVYLHGFGPDLGTGHWNQDGHRLAGETIARWLCPQLR